ncbi:tetratricopeptide repeat protein [Enterovibrio calviensis]|uniref:tetratricopeptide repeat protein n=1 Tax=Enterovibrio calviensis TaxID=91359 RepID=UPI000481B36D|nr:SEL1-like repeat protein [Enterovibrio calviensis]
MKWLFPLLFVSATSCSDETLPLVTDCPTEQNYSTAFLNSDFYQGWQTLRRGKSPRQNCDIASPYFVTGVSKETAFELSTLYLDFCNDTPDINALNTSSIYQSEKLTHGIDYDEFKWVLDLALCNSPVEQYALGKMLHDGFITDQDTEKGIYFLSLAAHQNHIQAQFALSNALEGINEDVMAALWLDNANHLTGQALVGRKAN